MDCPQSRDEIQPVVDALRRDVEARLDILWNPRCVLVAHGAYDAQGRLVAPQWEGRHQVVLFESATQTATWRPYEVICTVTPPATDAPRGVHALTHDGPYAPVGWWLYDHIRSIDRANVASLATISSAIDLAWERTLAAQDAATAEAVAAGCDRVYCDAVREGGVSVFHPVRIDLTAPVLASASATA